MNWKLAIWILFYGGIVILLWAVNGLFAAITFLSGLGVAVLTIKIVDYVMRER